MNHAASIVRLVSWAAFLILPAVGCQALKQRPAEQKAEERWNTVRARMKLQLAAQQADRGQFEESIAGATEAIALDPNNSEAYVLAAKAHLEFGRLASAEQIITAAAARNLNSPDLIYLNGVLLEQRGQLDAAVQCFGQALALGPAKLDYLIAEAECLVALARPEEALALLETKAHAFDDDAGLPTLAGRTALLLDRHDDAVRWFRQALTRNPASPSVSRELGLLLARMSRCREAIPILEPLTRNETEQAASGSVHRALAACYLVLDDPASAIATLAPYLDQHPVDASGQLLAAQAALATGDLLGVARYLHLAEKHGAAPAVVAFLRGVLASRQGDYRMAAEHLDRVLALDPSDSDAACLLGDALHVVGDLSGAVDAYSRALHAAPGSRWAEAGLARVRPIAP